MIYNGFFRHICFDKINPIASSMIVTKKNQHFQMLYYFIVAWILLVAGGFYVYFSSPDFFHSILKYAASFSMAWAYALYFILGSVRGITLIPSTYFIILGLFFFPPLPLFFLTLSGILVSSAFTYFFSEWLHLDEFFEKRYHERIARIKTALQKNELPIIIGWSFFPFLPTDLICYVCGTLKIDFGKFMLGVLIGESATCAIYIFGGNYLLRLLNAGSWL